MRIVGTVGLASIIPVMSRGRTALRHTSLSGAWWWLFGGMLLWDVAWITTVLTHLIPRGVADVLWYTTAVVLVCPAVAVLGARRPAARVWVWFVLIPLVLVLELPVVGLWNGAPLEIEIPALAGYLLVLLMGSGNYIGTRYAPAAILLIGALSLLVVPLSATVALSARTVEHGRMTATILLALASDCALRRSRRQTTSFDLSDGLGPFDALWIEFRDTFGIVWAQRIRERINRTAGDENWPVRLDRNGFVPLADSSKTSTDPTTCRRIEQTVRWLLRRFVDPEWIDHRLSSGNFPSRNGK